MIIGYQLYPADVEMDMISWVDPSLPFCQACRDRVYSTGYEALDGTFEPYDEPIPWSTFGSMRTDIGKLYTNFKLPPKKRYPMMLMLDGQMVVSEDFKRFCKAQGYTGLEFLPIQTKGYYLFVSHNMVTHDEQYQSLSIAFHCDICGLDRGVGGFVPPCLTNDEKPLADGIYVYDRYGDGLNFFDPTFVIGLETRDKLFKAGLTKGAKYKPIYQKSDYPNREECPTKSYAFAHLKGKV